MLDFCCRECQHVAHDAQAAQEHLDQAHGALAFLMRAHLGFERPGFGSAVWYWDQAHGAAGWLPAVVTGYGHNRQGFYFDVLLTDGRPRWGWGWQVVARVDDVRPPDRAGEALGPAE